MGSEVQEVLKYVEELKRENQELKKKKTFYEKVKEFHLTFGLEVNTTPTYVSKETCLLRYNLIKEEFEELAEGLGFITTIQEHQILSSDLVQIADGAADLHYVVSGTCVTFGIPEDEVFDEVHRSNMTKVWEDGTIHRREDGKILKPPTYSQADIRKILFKD